MLNLKKHILILLFLFIFQMFISNIVAWGYLRIISRSLKSNLENNISIFYNGEYNPLFLRYPDKNESWSKNVEKLKNYRVAIIKSNPNHPEEMYITAMGAMVKLVYSRNKIISYSIEKDYPSNSIIILPIFALILLLIGIFSFSLRTKTFTTWASYKYEATQFEKVTQFYGFGIILVTILVMWIRSAVAQ